MIQASSSENTIKPALSMLMPLVSILKYAGRYKKITKKEKLYSSLKFNTCTPYLSINVTNNSACSKFNRLQKRLPSNEKSLTQL